jgi:hypothetical protein
MTAYALLMRYIAVPFYITQFIILVTTSSNTHFTYVWVSYVQNYVSIIASLFATGASACPSVGPVSSRAVWAPGVARFLGAGQEHISAQPGAFRYPAQHDSSGAAGPHDPVIDTSRDTELTAATGAKNAKKLEEQMRSHHPTSAKADFHSMAVDSPQCGGMYGHHSM